MVTLSKYKMLNIDALFMSLVYLTAFHFFSYSVRVSNELGQGHPRATKYSVYITVFQSLLIGIICMIVVLVTKNQFAVIFTNSKDMQQAVAELAYLLGLTMILNSIQPVISGIIYWAQLNTYFGLTHSLIHI